MDKYSTAYSTYNLDDDQSPPRQSNDTFSQLGKRDANTRDYSQVEFESKWAKKNDVIPILIREGNQKWRKKGRVNFKPDHVLISEKYFKIDSEPNAPGLTPSEVDRIQ